MAIDPFAGLPRGQARVILADPPWRFKSYSEKDVSKMPQGHYACMSIEDIAALPVRSLADPAGCWLVMWATSPMLDQQIKVLESWGFTYKTQGQWLKLTKHGKAAFGTGHIYRSASEPWIVGSIGHPKQRLKNVRNIIMARTREHSRKPDLMRKNIEAMWEGPYLELFGRQAVANWTVWGDQVGRFPALDALPGARFVQMNLDLAA
jgi:N6-adenosine-specific RNA methylase IME4